jgi:hypothetical protein
MLGGGAVSPRYVTLGTANSNLSELNDAPCSASLVAITLEHCRPSWRSSGSHYVEGTRERLESILSKHHTHAVVVGHYPVLEQDEAALYERFGRSLLDVRTLSRILCKYPPIAYLCGHHHEGYIVKDTESGFLHINCGSSGKIGSGRALEIMIGSHAAANNLQVPEIGSYPHL